MGQAMQLLSDDFDVSEDEESNHENGNACLRRAHKEPNDSPHFEEKKRIYIICRASADSSEIQLSLSKPSYLSVCL